MTEIQQEILLVFKEVKKLLDKYCLTYIAIGGTAIGAVRHDGFIPWDDDLDIAMPREDYTKLITILKKELPEHLEVRTHHHSAHYCINFSKVINKNTTIIEERTQNYPDLDEGIYIDIMPFDGLPDNAFLRKLHILQLSVLNKLDVYMKLKGAGLRSSKSQLICKLLSPILFIARKLLPLSYFGDRFVAVASKYSAYHCNEFGFTWSYTWKDITIQSTDLNDMIELPFEDSQMKLLENYDGYLTQLFGNYMKLPPVEKQISHHGFVVIDFNTPYREYRVLHQMIEKEV